MARMTGGEALVKQLYREGVRVVFGLPGVQLYGVVAALRDEAGIRFIVTRHEQATSYMADGYARAGARPPQRVGRPQHGLRRLLTGADDRGPDPEGSAREEHRRVARGQRPARRDRTDRQVAAARARGRRR